MGTYRGMAAEDEKFFAEMIKRENQQRIAWFIKHKGGEIEEQEDCIKKENEAKKEYLEKSKRIEIRDNAKLEVGEIPLETMKPVNKETRKLIYIGTRHSDGGAGKYLLERYKLEPKEKFYCRESENWVYGWGVDGSSLSSMEFGRPIFAKTAIVKDSFYRKNGVGADPAHHRPPINYNAPFSPPIIP